MDKRIFKAYDIRGVYPSELDGEIFRKLGVAFGNIFGKKIVVGGDYRTSTPALKKSFIEGLIAAGCKVIDVGSVPTPVLIFSIKYLGCDGGISVTASHNPKEYNGMKFFNSIPVPIVRDGGYDKLVKLVESGERPDYIVLLEPTAPARQVSNIRDLVNLVIEHSADAGFTVLPVPTGHNAHWQLNISEDGKTTLINGDSVGKIIRRRQQLPQLYVRGGSTYVSKVENLLKKEPDIYGDDTRALVIDPKYALDLDNEEDWKEAEKILPSLVAE